jgi:hypothetical protein
MLISYKYKFIFVHNYKVAGNSISKAFKEYAYNSPLRIDNINKVTEGIKVLRLANRVIAKKIKIFPSYPPHATASELKEQIPTKIWNDFFKFGFVRNPWDWQVSLYHFMQQMETHFQNSLIGKMKSFDEYLEWRVNNDLHLQKDYIYDKQGNVLLDFVGKFENINKDFNEICNNIGIIGNLPHVNKSNHRDYRSYYNSYTKKLIEENFKDDIELFNYDF